MGTPARKQVSIPLQGLATFGRLHRDRPQFTDPRGFNPSSGLSHVRAERVASKTPTRTSFNPSSGLSHVRALAESGRRHLAGVSIPLQGLATFGPTGAGSPGGPLSSFNPSSGLSHVRAWEQLARSRWTLLFQSLFRA